MGGQIGPYRIESEPASDPGRLERFEREAKTLAQLNHPNLTGIHGVEEHEGARYLVIEFVEGETLADAGPNGRFGRHCGSKSGPKSSETFR